MPADAKVRRATAADVPDVARLFHDFQTEYDEPTPEIPVLVERFTRLIEREPAAIVLIGEGPDGFAQLRYRFSVYSEGLDAYLEELYVVPRRRGQGLGRALLEGAMESAREDGATNIELGTSEDDVAARGLYEALGFTNREGKPDGPVMYFYEREL